MYSLLKNWSHSILSFPSVFSYLTFSWSSTFPISCHPKRNGWARSFSELWQACIIHHGGGRIATIIPDTCGLHYLTPKTSHADRGHSNRNREMSKEHKCLHNLKGFLIAKISLKDKVCMWSQTKGRGRRVAWLTKHLLPASLGTWCYISTHETINIQLYVQKDPNSPLSDHVPVTLESIKICTVKYHQTQDLVKQQIQK